jgi:hypothetical protein
MLSLNGFYVFGHKSKNNRLNICMYSIFFSNFALKDYNTQVLGMTYIPVRDWTGRYT